MAIIDNRTLLTANDTTTGVVGLTGAAQGNQNTETFIEGTASVSLKVSSAVDGLLYDAGSAQDWSNNTFYIWWNVATADKLDTKAGGGVRIRFCGSTISNWFEVYVAGSDTYTGGFRMEVVSIETARSTAVANGWINGTVPPTTAIRYVGIVFDVVSTISGNFDNCFLDAMWILPANTPGIIVEGQNTNGVDWTWNDIVIAADAGDPTKAWGTVTRRDGVIFINTPIQFGANDATTHGFSDKNEVIGWENQLVDAGFYNLSIVGGSSTQSFVLGEKVGIGDSAVGGQGCVILAPSSGPRWDLKANDANINVCGLYGCTFIHGDNINLDNELTESISCQFIDCTASTTNGSTFLRNTIVNANTTSGTAYITTNDISNIKYSTFQSSAGHAIELTAPIIKYQQSEGNKFINYGADGTTNAVIYNSSGEETTIEVIGDEDLPTYRNAIGSTTNILFINSYVGIDENYGGLNHLQPVDLTGNPLENVQIRIFFKTDYDNNNLDSPVGITLSNNDGSWGNTIFVEPGYTYVVHFEKPGEFSPVTTEIVVT